MSQVNLQIGPDGQITSPGLHDAEILRLETKKTGGKETLEVGIAAGKGEAYQLLLEGVKLLKCSDFGSQNVILEAYFYSGVDPTATLRAAPKGFLHKTSDKDIADLAQQITSKKLGLLEITPSIGCSVLCLCEKLSITKK